MTAPSQPTGAVTWVVSASLRSPRGQDHGLTPVRPARRRSTSFGTMAGLKHHVLFTVWPRATPHHVRSLVQAPEARSSQRFVNAVDQRPNGSRFEESGSANSNGACRRTSTIVSK
jgi:hypothetical protein